MLNRFLVSFALALLGVFGLAGSAVAATIETRDDVMVLTAAVAGGLMAALLLIYAIKWYFGLDEQPPPPAPDDAHTAHH